MVHGLSIPALNLFYEWRKVPPIQESDATEITLLSNNEPLPVNAKHNSKRNTVIVYNRFSRGDLRAAAPTNNDLDRDDRWDLQEPGVQKHWGEDIALKIKEKQFV